MRSVAAARRGIAGNLSCAAHAQAASACVNNDQSCPAIEAQVDTLFKIANEVLKAKEMPRVDEVEARLGVTAERYRDTEVYQFRPVRGPQAAPEVPHMLFHGTHTTTRLATGTVSTVLSISMERKHACIGIDDLKSRLPGGKDEVRSFAHFETQPEIIQPIAHVSYAVDGEPEVRMRFTYFYQACLAYIYMDVRKATKE